MDVAAGIDMHLILYDQFRANTKEYLDGYINDEWLFLDPHLFVRNELLGDVDLGDGVHFNDSVQDRIAEQLSQELFSYICAQ